MSDTLDVHHYDVFWANSPDDEFTILNRRHVIPRSYTDTVAVDINQRYIYYYVRAVDYATNIGAPSDTIAVLRPSTVPPSRPHLDSAWVDNRMIHTRWIGGSDEMISHYNVYRRRPGAAWTLLRVADGDSVRAHGYALQIDDAPPAPLGARYEYAVETISLWISALVSRPLSPAVSTTTRCYLSRRPSSPTMTCLRARSSWPGRWTTRTRGERNTTTASIAAARGRRRSGSSPTCHKASILIRATCCNLASGPNTT